MTRPDALTVRYFDWLYEQVNRGDYLKLCAWMHNVPFQVVVHLDGNRVGDVEELRGIFLNHQRHPEDLRLPDATIFEILVVMAQKTSFMTNAPVDAWFQRFIDNLGLARFVDAGFESHSRQIDRIIGHFNNRTYRPDGRGGLFPLTRPLADQRDIELWYQMGAYLREHKLY